jgi:hypothetical protein
VDETYLVGHGNAEEAGIQLGCLDDFFDRKDSIAQYYLAVRISDYEIDRHGSPFIQLGDENSIEGIRRKHAE